jgi:hypothetical protein
MRALYSENDKIFYYADEKKDKISRNLIDFSLRRHAQRMKYEISDSSCADFPAFASAWMRVRPTLSGPTISTESPKRLK